MSASTNHIVEFMKNLKLILDNEQLCDVILIAVADAKRIPTHRLILSANSKYFKAMFTTGMKEAQEKEIPINDIDGEVLQSLVTHCYNETLILREDNVETILSAAHFMQFISIVDKCAEFLKNQLSPSNCLGIKFIAERFNCTKLESQALNFICANFYQVTNGEEFLQLSVDQLDSLLSQDDLNVQQEEDIFDSLISWVHYDEPNRKEKIPKLLQNVRMPLISTEFLVEQVKSVCKANECLDLYTEALEWKSEPQTCPDIDPKRITPRNLSAICLVVIYRLNSPEKYCPKLSQWSSMEEIEIKEFEFGITVWKDKLVVAGGVLNSEILNTVKYWDVKLKTWKDLCLLEASRCDVSLCVFEESLYALGGESNDDWENTVYRLDSLHGEWRMVAPMPITVKRPKSVVYDGCIYVEGHDNDYISHLQKYEPNTNMWTYLGTTLPDPITLVVINGDLYTIRREEIQIYNKNTNTWTTCSNNNCPDIIAACTFNNRLFVIVCENLKFDLKEYKLSDNECIVLTSLAMRAINDFIYIPLSAI